MITLILIFFAAVCNAVMDSIGDDVQYNQSIFSKLPFQFWNREQSWKYVKSPANYHMDAWHLFKSAMIILFACAAIFHKEIFSWYLDLIFYGAIWILTFNLFYSHLFKKRK